MRNPLLVVGSLLAVSLLGACSSGAPKRPARTPVESVGEAPSADAGARPVSIDASEAPIAEPGDSAPETSAEENPSVGQTNGNTRVRFNARVESVRMLSEYSGTAKPVHVDPRFALVLKVTEVTPAGMGVASNAREAFLIHSVAKLFRGGGIEDSVGGSFEFSVQRTQTPSGIRWSDLRVEPSSP